MKTMKELAQEVLDCQDAINLSGCVHAFSKATTELRALLEQEEGFSTTKLNRHPICIMWSSKIASLTGSDVDFSKAYDWVKSVIGNKPFINMPEI